MTAQVETNKTTIFTIFGASGDLAKLKLFPALYALALAGELPQDFYVIGFSRKKYTVEEFRLDLAESVFKKFNQAVNEQVLGRLLMKVHYYSGQYDSLDDFRGYKNFINQISEKNNDDLVNIAYFSIPPVVFNDVVQNLADSRISKDEDIRLVIEKPFGLDEHSAQELYHHISTYFEDDQVFLLDHYLGKRVIESILGLRHSNRVLNNMLRGPEIANIQIHALENFGVEERLGYFDQVGVIKDFIQSHILQILSLITMSIPMSKEPQALHREKEAILSAIKFEDGESNINIGQYLGYREQGEKVGESNTETYAAMRLKIDREEWNGVPIYIRTGKNLNRTSTYIVIEFKKYDFQDKESSSDKIILELKPSEKLHIKLVNVLHGHTEEINLLDSFECRGNVCFGEHAQLIQEVIQNKKINFLSFPEILASWKLIDSVVSFIKTSNLSPQVYKKGTLGPDTSNSIIEQDGFKWFEL